MATKPRKPWKRSKRTSALVYRIRTVIRDAGYDEEFAIVPLADTLSVLVNRGEDMFNLRLDKSTLQIVSTEHLQYNYKRDNVRLVFRRNV
jgi:hypothetical protein